MIARTWLVPAVTGQDERTEQTDDRASEADGGLSVHVQKVGLPEYLGVWLAPNGGHYHIYSDYPASHHERFGFVAPERS